MQIKKPMKVIIWVHKNDIIANKILTYHFTRPVIDRHNDYVQVLISVDEFVYLEDKDKDKDTQYSASIDGPGQRVSTGRSLDNYTYPEFIKEHYE
tara:strand:- start:3770 stop:4054 length:285 start_codon:yes stop_codon:yes gene_type:complete